MLPPALQSWWLEQFAQREGAYLSLSPAGLMVSSGGKLESYGLNTLRGTVPIPDQLDLLWGVFPWEDPISFPFAEVGHSWAEVHLWKADGVYWVVLLEVTQAARLQRAWHQSLNALELHKR